MKEWDKIKNIINLELQIIIIESENEQIENIWTYTVL